MKHSAAVASHASSVEGSELCSTAIEMVVECFCVDEHVKSHLQKRFGSSTKMAGVLLALAGWLAIITCCTNANVVRPDVQLPDYRQERWYRDDAGDEGLSEESCVSSNNINTITIMKTHL